MAKVPDTKSLTGIACLEIFCRSKLRPCRMRKTSRIELVVESMSLSAPLGFAVSVGQASEGRCVSSMVGDLTKAHHLLMSLCKLQCCCVLRRCLGALPCTPVRETPVAHGRTPHERLKLQVWVCRFIRFTSSRCSITRACCPAPGKKVEICPASDAPLNVTSLAIRSFGDLHEIDRVVVLAYQLLRRAKRSATLCFVCKLDLS